MHKYRSAALLLVFALASSGCMMNTYSSDPNRRIKELVNDGKDLRQIEMEVERFWMTDQPSHLTPERVHGGIPLDAPGSARPLVNPPVTSRPAVLVTVTVANVRKEQGLLFIVKDGELTFVQKLPHGEAIDLKAAPGTRYAAVFTSEPYQESFVVKDNATWLLRPAPQVFSFWSGYCR